MKKIGTLFVFFLCFVLCLAAFSSCGKKNGDGTTEPQTTAAPQTTAQPATTAVPTTTEAPATTASPQTTDALATTDAPATTAAPATTEAPTTTEASATTAAPATTEAPTTTEAPATTADPAATEPTVCAHVWSENGRLVTIPTVAKEGVAERYCTVCGATGDAYFVNYSQYTSQWSAIKTMNTNEFSSSDFGGTNNITTDLEKAVLEQKPDAATYDVPTVSPTVGQHPRVLFTESDIPGIRAALADPKNAAATKRFYEGILSMPDGKLGKATLHEKGTYKYIPNCTYNYDEEALRDIQSLALDYRLTGNKASGYQAIYAIKNYILTLEIVDVASDPERQYGSVMYTAACVYDWCYELLTPVDRKQIVAGVEHKIVCGDHMEIGFPPYKQYAVAGHGCEYQLLRDYLAFAIAIYDEYPLWWNYIAGRFFTEYVEARNFYYADGMIPQGVSLYIRVRFASDLYSAWLMKAATGQNPYNEGDMKQVMRSIYAYELPNGNGFAMGDSHETKIDGDFINYGLPAMMAAYLFNDSTIRAQLESRECCFTKFSDPDQDCFEYGSVTEYLICSSGGVEPASDVHEDIPLILYNGGWLGQIIARNSWDDDQATVLMKIGVRTGGNHDHQDAGQFQIFYKSMLAGDTGVYDSYSSEHRRAYHQQTVAHNSILVYDPRFEGSESGRYSGGQVKRGGDQMSHTGYLKDSNVTGELLGAAYGYADKANTKPTYAYIAGDITKAYDYTDVVSEVSRRMLTVYDTANPDVPMYFFVFDNITANNAASKKTFLLHVVGEPVIEGNTVTTVNGEGKLVLQNLFGGDTIEGIGGGPGSNYIVNGTQQVPNADATSQEDGYWGRVEISPATGNATDQLLNVMYVCDADKNPDGQTATAISTSVVKGAVIGNTAAVFVTSLERRTARFDFTTEGSGELNYYVSGVKAGRWAVKVGSTVKTVTATEEGGFITFTAPAGAVTVSPVAN